MWRSLRSEQRGKSEPLTADYSLHYRKTHQMSDILLLRPQGGESCASRGLKNTDRLFSHNLHQKVGPAPMRMSRGQPPRHPPHLLRRGPQLSSASGLCWKSSPWRQDGGTVLPCSCMERETENIPSPNKGREIPSSHLIWLNPMD